MRDRWFQIWTWKYDVKFLKSRYCVMVSNISISRVTHKNGSCHTWMSRVIHTELCHTWISGATHSNVCDKHAHTVWCSPWVWHDSFMCVTRLIRIRDTTHSYEWPDSLHVRHNLFICVTPPVYVWHDSFLCVTRLIHVWHDPFLCVTRLIYMCDTTSSRVSHDSFIRVTRPIYMQATIHAFRCMVCKISLKTNIVLPRSSVRFRQKNQKPKSQIYMYLSSIEPQARVLNYCFT